MIHLAELHNKWEVGMPTSHLIIIFIYLSAFYFILFLVLSNEEYQEQKIIEKKKSPFTCPIVYTRPYRFIEPYEANFARIAYRAVLIS